MIEIKSEKIVDTHGIKCRKILAIEGVKVASDLPDEYIEGFHFRRCCSVAPKIVFHNMSCNDNPEDFGVGTVLTEVDYEYSIKKMGECAIRLSTVNMGIKLLKKEWNGTETVLI